MPFMRIWVLLYLSVLARSV